MKKSVLIYIAVISSFLASVILFADVNYQWNEVFSDENSGNIVLSWQTMQENGLKEIGIMRKSVNGTFVEIDLINAKGDYSTYEYIDENAFKTNDAVYTYKLKFVNNDSSISYSSEKSILHLTSVGQQTWGSIKALFR